MRVMPVDSNGLMNVTKSLRKTKHNTGFSITCSNYIYALMHRFSNFHIKQFISKTLYLMTLKKHQLSQLCVTNSMANETMINKIMRNKMIQQLHKVQIRKTVYQYRNNTQNIY